MKADVYWLAFSSFVFGFTLACAMYQALLGNFGWASALLFLAALNACRAVFHLAQLDTPAK